MPEQKNGLSAAFIAKGAIVPFVLKYGYGVDMPLILMVIYIAAGEIVGCYILGEIFATVLIKRNIQF